MKVISSNNAPKAIGPYSQAVLAGDFLYISGQLPIDVATGQMAHDIQLATKYCLNNIISIVTEAGGNVQNIVKINVFLKNMNDFSKMNEIYASVFQDHKPARAAVEVARLPKDAIIEIEAVAYIK